MNQHFLNLKKKKVKQEENSQPNSHKFLLIRSTAHQHVFNVHMFWFYFVPLFAVLPVFAAQLGFLDESFDSFGIICLLLPAAKKKKKNQGEKK